MSDDVGEVLFSVDDIVWIFSSSVNDCITGEGTHDDVVAQADDADAYRAADYNDIPPPKGYRPYTRAAYPNRKY